MQGAEPVAGTRGAIKPDARPPRWYVWNQVATYNSKRSISTILQKNGGL